MNFAAMIFPQRIVEALGWTLFHALWQGALAALGFAVVLYFSRRTSSRLRYGLGLAILVLVLLMSGLTFFNHYRTGGEFPAAAAAPAARAAAALPQAAPGQVAAAGPSLSRRIAAFFSDYFGRNLPLFVTLWLLGVLFLALRFSGGLLYVQRLKYRQNRPLPSPWPEKLQELAARAGLRRPLLLLESLRLKTPVVIGHLKPVLLLPAGLVSGLPADEVEALLAHELAHVLRRDYLVNVLQSLVDILFFFHPGIRWISAAVRQEREHCCDDFAVELCGDARSYAVALARLQVAWSGTPGPALAAAGPAHKLLRRIARLLGRPSLVHDFREGFVSALLLVFCLLGMLKLAGAAAPVAAAAEIKPKAAAAAKSRAAGRFVLVSFVLETAGTVRLEGGVPTKWGKLPSTWLVDGRDGRVVWYMTLAPSAKQGQLIPYSEEVSLEAGTYGWYFPMGSAIGVLRKNTDGKEPWTFLHVENGGSDFLLQRRRNDVEMLRAEREEKFLKQELSTMSVDERELKEKELQKLAEERAELDQQLALAGNKRKLKQEQEQALIKYVRQLKMEQSLQEEKLIKYEEELKKLSGAQRELKEKEIQKFTQELRAKADDMQALNEKERQAYEAEKLMKEEQLLQAEQLRKAGEELKTLSGAEREQKEKELKKMHHEMQEMAEAKARLHAVEKSLRAEKERLRDEELKFKKFMAELVAAGLVDEAQGYEVKLSAAALVINGKKQPAAVHEKIRRFYETLTSQKLDDKRTVTIVHDKD